MNGEICKEWFALIVQYQNQIIKLFMAILNRVQNLIMQHASGVT